MYCREDELPGSGSGGSSRPPPGSNSIPSGTEVTAGVVTGKAGGSFNFSNTGKDRVALVLEFTVAETFDLANQNIEYDLFGIRGVIFTKEGGKVIKDSSDAKMKLKAPSGAPSRFRFMGRFRHHAARIPKCMPRAGIRRSWITPAASRGLATAAVIPSRVAPEPAHAISS